MRPAAEDVNDIWRVRQSVEKGVYAGQQGNVSGGESTPAAPAADDNRPVVRAAVAWNAEGNRFEILNICRQATSRGGQRYVGLAEEEGLRHGGVICKGRDHFRGRHHRVRYVHGIRAAGRWGRGGVGT
jgi:hypothetical protein